jgi:hypothetical protein
VDGDPGDELTALKCLLRSVRGPLSPPPTAAVSGSIEAASRSIAAALFSSESPVRSKPLTSAAFALLRRGPSQPPILRRINKSTEENAAVQHLFAELQTGRRKGVFACLICGLSCGPLHETSVNSLIYNWLLADKPAAMRNTARQPKR